MSALEADPTNGVFACARCPVCGRESVLDDASLLLSLATSYGAVIVAGVIRARPDHGRRLRELLATELGRWSADHGRADGLEVVMAARALVAEAVAAGRVGPTTTVSLVVAAWDQRSGLLAVAGAGGFVVDEAMAAEPVRVRGRRAPLPLADTDSLDEPDVLDFGSGRELTLWPVGYDRRRCGRRDRDRDGSAPRPHACTWAVVVSIGPA